MTSLTPQKTEIFYPSSDGKPLAESYIHLYAILTTLEVLKQYLQGRQATVLADQFLYYAQGYPRLRVASDVMVIFDVAPGGRDNYKIWEEGQIPVLKSKKIKVKSKKIIPINKLRGFGKDVLFLALRVSKQMFLLCSINKFRGFKPFLFFFTFAFLLFTFALFGDF